MDPVTAVGGLSVAAIVALVPNSVKEKALDALQEGLFAVAGERVEAFFKDRKSKNKRAAAEKALSDLSQRLIGDNGDHLDLDAVIARIDKAEGDGAGAELVSRVRSQVRMHKEHREKRTTKYKKAKAKTRVVSVGGGKKAKQTVAKRASGGAKKKAKKAGGAKKRTKK